MAGVRWCTAEEITVSICCADRETQDGDLLLLDLGCEYYRCVSRKL